MQHRNFLKTASVNLKMVYSEVVTRGDGLTGLDCRLLRLGRDRKFFTLQNRANQLLR